MMLRILQITRIWLLRNNFGDDEKTSSLNKRPEKHLKCLADEADAAPVIRWLKTLPIMPDDGITDQNTMKSLLSLE